MKIDQDLSKMKIDQAEVDKDSARRLPKVPPKDCERVH